jgi:CheY-like chemotaxis protein
MVPILDAAVIASRGDRLVQDPVLVDPDAVRVVIADVQPVVRAGFHAVLEGERDLAVTGAAATVEEVIALVRETQPDVALLDLELPDVGGIEATRRLLDDPICAGVKVLILAAQDGEDDLFAALRTGARGGRAALPERHAPADRRVCLPTPAGAPEPGAARRADRART